MEAIAEITSYAEYEAFGERLRALQFHEDVREGAPLYRWVHHETTLDVMPLEESILGFSNRWYRAAMDSSVIERLAHDLEIRIVTGPYLLATKLEAFRGRGQGDFLGSHDLDRSSPSNRAQILDQVFLTATVAGFHLSIRVPM